MSCYTPLRGYCAKDGRWVSKPPTDTTPKKMNVRCGSCMGCRVDNAQHWAARIIHETQEWDHSRFLTLTYDDEHMPRLFNGGPGTLIKKHLQDFIKRIRDYTNYARFSYYACGEYGDQTYRPHYHACAFNLKFSDEQLYSYNGDHPLFISETLQNLWGKGFATIGQLTYESAAYTSRYILKKITGTRAQDHYLRVDDYGVAYWLEPEFTTMSKGRLCHKCKRVSCPNTSHAIGARWLAKYQDDVYPSDEIPVVGKGNLKGVPRFYDKLLEKADPDLFQTVKKRRADYAKNNPLEFTPQSLEAKYKCRKALQQHLKREKI